MQLNMAAQQQAQMQAMQGMLSMLQNIMPTSLSNTQPAPTPPAVLVMMVPHFPVKLHEPCEFNGKAEEVMPYIDKCKSQF
jgi:hypothetical protein